VIVLPVYEKMLSELLLNLRCAPLDVVEQQVNEERSTNDVSPWVYDDIIAHQDPLKPTDPFYKGSSYNVLVRWMNGEETYEPLYDMIKDDPILVVGNNLIMFTSTNLEQKLDILMIVRIVIHKSSKRLGRACVDRQLCAEMCDSKVHQILNNMRAWVWRTIPERS
jgi:hypothetical protein